MGVAEVEKLPPQVGIDRLFPLVAHPAVAAPTPGPALFDTPNHVLRIAVQRNAATLIQGLEALDRSHQLHAVVGRPAIAATELAAMLAINQHNSVPARTGIADASPVGVDDDVFFRRHQADALAMASELSSNPASASRWQSFADVSFTWLLKPK